MQFRIKLYLVFAPSPRILHFIELKSPQNIGMNLISTYEKLSVVVKRWPEGELPEAGLNIAIPNRW